MRFKEKSVILGVVTKTNNNTFIVYSNNNYYNCFSQKKVKNKSIVFVGDNVEFEKVQNEYLITKILPRKNKLIRPFVTNVTQIFIMITSIPQPDLVLIDKLIINAKQNKITPIMLVNKCDLGLELFNQIKTEYEKSGIEIINISTIDKTNIDTVQEKLKNNISVLAGQSATGKTSLLNLLCGTNNKTNTVSERNLRGKNTTTNAELIVLGENTFLLDTAGFSRLELASLDPIDIKNYYKEFNFINCTYKNCTHVNEGSKCEIINNLTQENSKIHPNRYKRYIQIYEECLNFWRKRYD